ncbi:hypothetical protein [Halogeometricum pallidum]|nr:hypothetical protein [Halogeometricum pallidum]
MALFPAKFLAVMQDLAVENPDDFVERRWLTSYVRMEGLVTVLICLKGERAYSAYMKYLGIVGVTLLFFPRRYVEVGNRVAYEGSSPFEWKTGYLSRLRVCGAFFIFLSLQALKGEDDTS